MSEAFSKEAVERADTALQKALVTNFEPLDKVEVWFVGGAILTDGDKPTGSKMEAITLNAFMHYTDGGEEKLRYDLNEKDMAWMTGARSMHEWATGYLAAHLARTIYRIEHSKADFDFPELKDSLAVRIPDYKRKTENDTSA